MEKEYLTEKGSKYAQKDDSWYHSREGIEILLERGLRVTRSVLEDVLLDYNLNKGDFVEEDKREVLFNDLKQESNLGTGGELDYRIVFLSQSYRLGYSSKLVDALDEDSLAGELKLADNLGEGSGGDSEIQIDA